MIHKFDQIVAEVKSSTNRIIAVAVAQDQHILEAVNQAKKANIAEAILLGDQSQIEKISNQLNINLTHFEVVHVPNELEAIHMAIKFVQQGKANLLMKGLCSTANLMKAVLDKDKGLRHGTLLSHLGIFEVSTYPKLVFMSDGALNIAPTLTEKIAITENAIEFVHKFGITEPKVAIIAAVEKVNPEKMPATVDAAILAKMADRGQLKGAIVDGPLAVDNAFSKKSCEIKGIQSKVGGETDIAIVPDIEAGNIFYKLMTYLAGAKTAGLILGAKVPIILASRADSDVTKFLSIASAARVA
jgi:phosphate butyryltransferase